MITVNFELLDYRIKSKKKFKCHLEKINSKNLLEFLKNSVFEFTTSAVNKECPPLFFSSEEEFITSVKESLEEITTVEELLTQLTDSEITFNLKIVN